MPVMAVPVHATSPIPSRFCWTKYGTEAGEEIEQILERKEQERAANDGIFLWGIGNSVAPSLRELLGLDDRPEVIFSPMLSRPTKADVKPSAVARWRRAWDLEGRPFVIPRHSLVTSRFSECRPRHFALVCHSERPLHHRSSGETLSLSELRNLARGTPVGSSQVTSVVQRTLGVAHVPCRSYRVGFRAILHPPYFVKLADPVVCVA